MPGEKNKSEFGPLSDYTSCLAFYQGKGTLTLSNQQAIACTFEVGQLRQGDVFLLCSASSNAEVVDAFLLNVERFDGTTAEGFHLSTEGKVYGLRVNGDQLTCHLQKLVVEMVKGIQPHTVHFGITNFVFDKGFPLHLEHAGIVTSVRVEPIEQHSHAMKRVELLRTIDVTCEVVGSLLETTDTAELEQAVDNLCYLFSVARGTKIEWIYEDFYSETGTCLSRAHESRVTKAYGALSIIRFDQEIRAFVEGTYSTYATNRERYKLNMGTIDTYLDAKAEADYLQMRGIKLAVSMEVIKDVFTNLPDSPVKEFVSNKNAFNKKLIPALSEAIFPILEKANITLTKQILREKLQDLNRRAFGDLLNDIFERISLQIEDEDRKRFIQCRNSLVHQGRFYCETSKQEAPNHEELVQEYCFLVSVVDKVFLKLLGYRGIYLDRRIPGQTIHKELV